MRRILHHDKELRTCRIRVHRSRHRKHTSFMFEVVFEPVSCEFTWDAVARTAHSCSVRTATLDHESRNHSVENKSVIKTFFYEFNKVLNCLRRDLRVKLALHDTAVFHFDFYVFHFMFLLLTAPAKVCSQPFSPYPERIVRICIAGASAAIAIRPERAALQRFPELISQIFRIHSRDALHLFA